MIGCLNARPTLYCAFFALKTIVMSPFVYSLNRLHVPGGCVATIGSFDGVHLGHQFVLQQVIDLAKDYGLPALVIVFEPQPNEFFAPDNDKPVRLTGLREKVTRLLKFGVDSVICLKFNDSLRELTAKSYIEHVLVNGLALKHLVIGDDFRFGCDRSGDFQMLQEAGGEFGFSVVDSNTFKQNAARISSTRIRKLLLESRLSEVQKLLGRPYQLAGKVVYGKQLGRQIGFPTVNIGLGRHRPPLHGVYAVNAKNETTNDVYDGVANIGMRPTINQFERPALEVHLFGVDEYLYGQFIRVTFVKKIREEHKFESIDSLKEQIQKDIFSAKRILKVT